MKFFGVLYVRPRWFPLIGSLFLLISPFFAGDGVPFWACSTAFMDRLRPTSK